MVQTAPSITGYELIGRLGESPAGMVWEALQLSTGRRVALHLFSEESLGSEEQKHRFLMEMESAASLEHPNIARVYESGLNDGFYYCATDLLNGLPLDQFVEQSNMDCRQILELTQPISAALQYAHARGVVHRDLNTSRILIDGGGPPHIVGFGLVQPPEEEDCINTSGNVHALGLIVYRLLINRGPHELDAELEALLLKAAADDPAEGFQTAGEFHDDIDNYLNGRPTGAGKKPRRHRALAAAILMVFVVAGALTVGVRSRGRLREWLSTIHVDHAAQPPADKETPAHAPPPERAAQPAPIRATQPSPTRSAQPARPASQPVTHGSLAVAAPIKAKTETLWQQVKNLDRAQGFANWLDQASVLRSNGDALFERRVFDEAADTYAEFMRVCGNIQALDAARQLARRARDSAQTAAETAHRQGADGDAADLWTQSQSLAAEAQRRFDSDDFAAAKAGWEQAAQAAASAGRKSADVARIRQAKQQYVTALGAGDVSRLEQFGGDEWNAVKDSVARADAAAQAGDAATAVAAYGDAARLVPAAVAAAGDRFHKNELSRVQPEIDQHVAAAKALIRRQLSIGAMEEVQKALALNAADETARSLRDGLLKRDVDGLLTLNLILPPLQLDGSFSDCVQKLQGAAGLKIVIDSDSLKQAGMNVHTPVKATFLPARLESVLGQLTNRLGGRKRIGYSVDQGTITISIADKLASRTQTIVYHVNDLCRSSVDFEVLSQRISGEVDPLTWRANGGSPGHIEVGAGILVITQTQEDQRLVDQFLQKLRQK